MKCSLPEGYFLNDENSSADGKETKDAAVNEPFVEPSCSGFEYPAPTMDNLENPIELDSSEDDNDDDDDDDDDDDNDQDMSLMESLNNSDYNSILFGNGKHFKKKKKFCFFCNKMLITKIDVHLELHDALKLVYDSYKFPQCEFCHVMFYSVDELLSHHQQEHEEEPLPEISDRTEQASEAEESIFYKCSVCEAYYTDLDVMKNHMLTHFKKFVCPLDDCKSEYSDFVMFGKHLQDRHVIECMLCKVSKFNSYNELREHMKSCNVI